MRDDANGKGSGECRHDIERRAGVQLIEQLRDRGLDEWTPRLDRLRREVLVQQAAHVRVSRWVLFHELRAAKPAHLVEKRQSVLIERRIRPPPVLSLIHISEPTRLLSISYA